MADLLLFRYWWCPETEAEKNVLMARIIETAVRGRNEVVLIFAMEKAAAYYKGRNRTAFLEKYSLPFLKKHGFARAYAAMRIQAGLEYFRCEDAQAGFSALREAAESTASSDIYHAYALAVGQTERLLCSSYAETDPQKYNICTQSLELRMVHGNLCHWDRIGYTLGQMRGDFLRADDIFRCASCCGGYFVRQNLSVGDVYTAEDGSTLCFTADSVTVHTPAGVFHDCQMWTAQQKTQTIHTYYKEGIGIVRLERICDGEKNVRVLKDYTVRGRWGWLPFAGGNRWEYVPEVPQEIISHTVLCETEYADDDKVILNLRRCAQRIRYDDTSWRDTMRQITEEYYRTIDERQHLCDVSEHLRRAEKLAKTPLEKAHTAASSRVMERILRTDPVYSPHSAERGIWNFFQRTRAALQDGTVRLTLESIWHFEWKNRRDMTDAGRALLYNNIYGMLQYMTGCIWSEQWKNTGERIVRHEFAGCMLETLMHISWAGEITVKAGTFSECMKIDLSAKGFQRGMAYIGEKKTYYFAPGIGIVRLEQQSIVYELTAYSGTGEGHMPLSDGMMRKYEAQKLRDGYIGGAEYTYCADEDGTMVILGDLIGVKTEQNQNTEENP